MKKGICIKCGKSIRYNRWKEKKGTALCDFCDYTKHGLYGLDLKLVKAELYEEQGGECACCHIKIELSEGKLDHCHITGKRRGLLCHSCNAGLGFFRDDTVRLRLAIVYLKGYEE